MLLLDEAKAYIGFGDDDTAALQAFRVDAKPHYTRIIDHFYDRIMAHPDALAVISGGAEQVDRLKCTLVDWLDTGMQGPHDLAFYENRARIGRMHVRIGLPQRYMFTAMNVIRVDLRRLLDEVHGDDPAQRARVGEALDRWLDLELAIMLHTYREDSDDRLDRQARLAAIGQLAASIAHELRNPLSVIESSLYLLRRRVDEDDRVTRHLDRIQSQVKTSADIIAGLLEMARDRAPHTERVRADRLVLEALEAARVVGGVEVQFIGEAGAAAPWVEAEPGLVVRALVNVIDNAVRAYAGAEGRVEVQVRGESGDVVAFHVRDHGPGFDVSVLPRAFEPLVTTRPTGVGLGLALVRRVAERHGGRVEAFNRAAGGAEVVLRLPGAK